MFEDLGRVFHFWYDHTLAVTLETAKEAFAKAVEWHVGEQLNNVSINDGTKNYTVPEFSSVIALKQIADTVEANAALRLAHGTLPPSGPMSALGHSRPIRPALRAI